MRRTIALTSILVTSIAGIALAQSLHHGDANSGGTTSADSTFASQMMQAMDRMDSGMMAAKPTGDPDRDFAAMMIRADATQSERAARVAAVTNAITDNKIQHHSQGI